MSKHQILKTDMLMYLSAVPKVVFGALEKVDRLKEFGVSDCF